MTLICLCSAVDIRPLHRRMDFLFLSPKLQLLILTQRVLLYWGRFLLPASSHPIGPPASRLCAGQAGTGEDGSAMLTQSQQRRAERRGTFEFYHVSHNGACLQKTDGAKCEANRFLGNMRSRGPFSPEHASVWWNHTHTHTHVSVLYFI